MKFREILDDEIVAPGEYVYYESKRKIVLCGAFNREENFIRALSEGRLVQDKISEFKKINLTRAEQDQYGVSKCKGCSG